MYRVAFLSSIVCLSSHPCSILNIYLLIGEAQSNSTIFCSPRFSHVFLRIRKMAPWNIWQNNDFLESITMYRIIVSFQKPKAWWMMTIHHPRRNTQKWWDKWRTYHQRGWTIDSGSTQYTRVLKHSECCFCTVSIGARDGSVMMPLWRTLRSVASCYDDNGGSGRCVPESLIQGLGENKRWFDNVLQGEGWSVLRGRLRRRVHEVRMYVNVCNVFSSTQYNAWG